MKRFAPIIAGCLFWPIVISTAYWYDNKHPSIRAGVGSECEIARPEVEYHYILRHRDGSVWGVRVGITGRVTREDMIFGAIQQPTQDLTFRF